MADDKPTLTRRRVLGSMAVVGGAGALGAGTWATFTDEEQKHVTVSAGTVNLEVEHEGKWYDGETVYVEGGPLKNGGVFKDCETLKNTGTITADTLRIGLSNLENFENGRVEPEIAAGDPGEGNGPDSGELSKYLSIKGTLNCDGDSNPCTPGANGRVGYIPLEDAIGEEIEVDVNMASGGACDLCFWVKLDEEFAGTENANDAMSDSVEFDMNLAIEQNSGPA